MDSTSAKIPENLYGEFLKVMGRGDERAAKDFLITNLKQFPQEVQETIITAFFEEALVRAKTDAAAVANFQKQGMQVAKGMEQLKEGLEAKAKILGA
jgi:hypothetical protein